MLIACPRCDARYDVDDQRFYPAGQSVRCADCAASWFVPAPRQVETLRPADKVRPAAPEEPAQASRQPERRRHPRNGDIDPIAASHLRRRESDEIVDTDWEEVAQPYHGARRQDRHDPRVRERPARAQAASHDTNAGPAGWKTAPQRGNAFPDDAPGEVFAAINVQPRELERALRKVRRKAEARHKNRLTPFRLLGWFLLIIVCTGTFGGLFLYRDEVMKRWPGTARAYAVIGIDAKPFGLRLENISHRLALSTAGPVLEISGELHNDGNAPVETPLLLAEALDSRGRLLSGWTFDPQEAVIAGGAYTAFSTRNRAPTGVAEVVLSFARRESRTLPEKAGQTTAPDTALKPGPPPTGPAPGPDTALDTTP